MSLCLVGRCSTLSKSPVALESAALGGTHVVSVHLVEQFDGTWKVSEAHTHVDHAVVEHLVGPLSELARASVHLL